MQAVARQEAGTGVTGSVQHRCVDVDVVQPVIGSGGVGDQGVCGLHGIEPFDSGQAGFDSQKQYACRRQPGVHLSYERVKVVSDARGGLAEGDVVVSRVDHDDTGRVVQDQQFYVFDGIGEL